MHSSTETETILVQHTTVKYKEKKLGWEPVYAKVNAHSLVRLMRGEMSV